MGSQGVFKRHRRCVQKEAAPQGQIRSSPLTKRSNEATYCRFDIVDDLINQAQLTHPDGGQVGTEENEPARAGNSHLVRKPENEHPWPESRPMAP